MIVAANHQKAVFLVLSEGGDLLTADDTAHIEGLNLFLGLVESLECLSTYRRR